VFVESVGTSSQNPQKVFSHNSNKTNHKKRLYSRHLTRTRPVVKGTKDQRQQKIKSLDEINFLTTSLHRSESDGEAVDGDETT
jgi:hypothetical protein